MLIATTATTINTIAAAAALSTAATPPILCGVCACKNRKSYCMPSLTYGTETLAWTKTCIGKSITGFLGFSVCNIQKENNVLETGYVSVFGGKGGDYLPIWALKDSTSNVCHWTICIM